MIASFVPLVSSGLHDWLARWAPLADWSVAAGTALLAFATFYLALKARAEARSVADDSKQIAAQVALQREQIARADRAHVFPSTPTGWAIGAVEWQGRRAGVLPIKNGGPGLALNVNGKVYWRNQGAGEAWRTVTIYAGTIASGDEVEARLSANVNGWADAIGYLFHSDLAGEGWLTEFKYILGDGNQLVCEHKAPELTAEADIWRRFPPR